MNINLSPNGGNVIDASSPNKGTNNKKQQIINTPKRKYNKINNDDEFTPDQLTTPKPSKKKKGINTSIMRVSPISHERNSLQILMKTPKAKYSDLLNKESDVKQFVYGLCDIFPTLNITQWNDLNERLCKKFGDDANNIKNNIFPLIFLISLLKIIVYKDINLCKLQDSDNVIYCTPKRVNSSSKKLCFGSPSKDTIFNQDKNTKNNERIKYDLKGNSSDSHTSDQNIGQDFFPDRLFSLFKNFEIPEEEKVKHIVYRIYGNEPNISESRCQFYLALYEALLNNSLFLEKLLESSRPICYICYEEKDNLHYCNVCKPMNSVGCTDCLYSLEKTIVIKYRDCPHSLDGVRIIVNPYKSGKHIISEKFTTEDNASPVKFIGLQRKLLPSNPISYKPWTYEDTTYKPCKSGVDITYDHSPVKNKETQKLEEIGKIIYLPEHFDTKNNRPCALETLFFLNRLNDTNMSSCIREIINYFEPVKKTTDANEYILKSVEKLYDLFQLINDSILNILIEYLKVVLFVLMEDKILSDNVKLIIALAFDHHKRFVSFKTTETLQLDWIYCSRLNKSMTDAIYTYENGHPRIKRQRHKVLEYLYSKPNDDPGNLLSYLGEKIEEIREKEKKKKEKGKKENEEE